MKWALCVCVLAACLVLTAGCGMSPKPWQRGDLANPRMAWDPDPLDAAARDHTYFSKEAASGSVGAGAGGGGCGCN
jgi:hypothetical protein